MNKIKRLDLHYILIYVSIFLGTGCLGGYLSAYLLDIGFSNTYIGTTLACAGILGIILQPIAASIADKLKKISLRTMIVGLYVVSCTLTVIIWSVPRLFPSFVVLPTAVLIVLLNAVSGVEGSLVTSLGMEHNYGGNSINFSLARGCGSFSYAVSSLIFGFLVERFGSGFLVPTHFGMLTLTLVIVATFPRPKHDVSDGEKEEEQEGNASSLFGFAKENPRFMAVILGTVLLYTATIIFNVLPIQLYDNIGGTEAQVGVGTFIAAFLELPAMAIFPVLLKRIGSVTKIMKFAAIMLAIKGFLTGFAPSVEFLYVAQILQFCSFALFFPASVYYVNRFVPKKDKVKGQSFMGMTLTVSSVIISLFGGRVIDSIGIGFLARGAAFICAAGAIMLMFFLQKDNTPGVKKAKKTE